MRIDEAGQDGFTVKIEHLGFVGLQSHDVLVITDLKNPAAFYSHCLPDGKIRIDRNNLSVV
jgi:hypothetical protein